MVVVLAAMVGDYEGEDEHHYDDDADDVLYIDGYRDGGGVDDTDGCGSEVNDG